MAVLAGEQADGPHPWWEKILGGEQQFGADSAPLPVGCNHQPDKLGGVATDMGADARDEPARFADTPAVTELFAELGMQLRQRLGQRRDLEVPVSLGLGHECCSLQRQHLTGLTGGECGERSGLIHVWVRSHDSSRSLSVLEL